MFARGMECADHDDGRLAHLVQLTDYSGDSSRKRQTRRETGTQSHGSGLILTAGLPKEGHASLLGTWWSPAEREPRCSQATARPSVASAAVFASRFWPRSPVSW